MANVTLKMKQDKICKNSVRFSADKADLKSAGVISQPFTIYVPNGIIPEDNPPAEIEITVSFK